MHATIVCARGMYGIKPECRRQIWQMQERWERTIAGGQQTYLSDSPDRIACILLSRHTPQPHTLYEYTVHCTVLLIHNWNEASDYTGLYENIYIYTKIADCTVTAAKKDSAIKCCLFVEKSNTKLFLHASLSYQLALKIL